MRREELRLRRVFERFLRASLAIPLATVACSKAPGPDGGTQSRSLDAGIDDRCSPRVAGTKKELIDGQADLLVFDRLACGVPASARRDGGGCSLPVGDCQELCTYGACSCRATDASCPGGRIVEGPAVIACDLGCLGSIGRRPRGLVTPAGAESGTALGDFFSRAAHLEAASVHAFESLGAALRRLGTPEELVAAAAAAARDETRHAALTERLARRFGAAVPAVRLRSFVPPSSLSSVAFENAREGCARETFGALVAMWQACHAADAEISLAARSIAEDEIRHASLAWALLHWAAPNLLPEERQQMTERFRAAVRELEVEAVEPDAEFVRVAGLPDRRQQRAMLDVLGATLWRDRMLS